MRISSVFETDQGGLKIEGDLTSEELAFLIDVGLKTLLQQGVMMGSLEVKDVQIQETNETVN